MINERLPASKDWAVYHAPFQFFNVRFDLYSDSAELLEPFNNIYKRFRLRCSAGPNRDNSFYVRTRRVGKTSPFILIGDQLFPVHCPEMLPSLTHMHIVNAVMNRVCSHFVLHGGVVSKDGQGVVITGPPSFGKTTLIIELAQRGFKFLSDEFAAVNRQTGQIDPFPRCIGIRNGTKRLFDLLALEDVYSMRNIGPNDKWLCDVEDVYKGGLGESCKPHTIIFLQLDNSESKMTDSHLIDIALMKEDKTILDAFTGIDGVSLTKTMLGSGYILYRFLVSKQTGTGLEFLNICEENSETIIYTERSKETPPVFDRSPTIKPAGGTGLILKLLKDMKNGAQDGQLYREFDGRVSPVLMELGRMLKDVRCYRLSVGNLKEMADLVCDIVEG
ncbi:MAG: hypothetical protein ACE5IH_07535 [Thermodesulfobacteriota bacterium]